MTPDTFRRYAIHFGAVLSGLWLLAAAQAQDAGIDDRQSSLHRAQELVKSGQELQRKRAYADSIPPAEQALAIYEKLSGAESLDAAEALDLLGRGQRFAGDFAHAEPNIRKALGIRERLLGPDDLLTASTLNNLGGFFSLTYRNKEAEGVYQRVLAIREKALGSSHPDTAQALNNLAGIYANTGRYERARLLFERALGVFEKAFGPDSLQAADTLTNIAGTYERMGESSRAEPFLERSIAIKEKILGAGNPSIATELENLARAREFSGAIDLALPVQLRALELREKSLGPEHPSVATTLHMLANIYKHLGEFGEAEKVFLRARAIREKTLGSDNLATAYVLNDLADLYYATGRYAEARTLLERALDIKEKVGSLDASYALSLHDLAKVNAHLGEEATAATYFQRALARRESVLGLQHPYVEETLNEWAALEWARGERVKALAMLQRARKIQAGSAEPFLLGSESRKRAYLQTLSEDTYRDVSFALATREQAGVLLGLDSVLQYKSLVLDIMSDSAARLRASVRPEDRALFEQFTDVAGRLSALAYQGGGNSAESRTQRELLRAQQEKLETQLSARSVAFRQQIAPTTVAALRRAIPPTAAFVEWFLYTPFAPLNAIAQSKAAESHPAPRYAAFIVRRNVDPVVIDVGEAKQVEALVQDFRRALSDANADTRASTVTLSRRLIEPLSLHLKGVEQLLLSPDSALNLVPMAALIDSNGDVLARRFEISYLTSGRDLLRATAKSKSQGPDVIVANANFGLPTYLVGQPNALPSALRSVELDRGGFVFRPLANTELEAQDLKAILDLPTTSLLLRDDATEARLRELHGPRILHIASHGFFLSAGEFAAEVQKRGVSGQLNLPADENPLVRSGIALSGANARHSGERDDGILTALEAAQLDLHGTELVVLSACDTGIGEVTNGDGVYGLRRALVLAGAQTQVTSLWKVSDEATRKLMANYYERLLKGEGRAAALRHAQLDMLAMPQYSHPYYWASFVSAGSWKPLSSSQRKSSVDKLRMTGSDKH